MFTRSQYWAARDQHLAPGRAVEFGDVIANGAGVSCGTLLGLPIRTLIAIL